MLAGAEEHRKRPIVPLDEKHVEERSVDWQDLGVAFANGEELPDALTYMFRRGFSADTLDEWEVGYDTILEMISIPWRNPAGELIAFKGRAWWPNAKPKYRMLGNKEGREDRYEFDTIDISQTLYGLWKVEAGLGRVILCEGELNNIAMWQFGYHNVLGLSGQFLSETQAIILAGIADEVVLLFDEEEKALRAAELLEGSVRVWIVPERDGDPADSCEAEVEEWLDGLVDPLLVQCGL